jgi:hypothetical protein
LKAHLNPAVSTKVPVATNDRRFSGAGQRWNFRDVVALILPRGIEANCNLEALMLSTILIVILILILVGALPTWGYSSGWGYGPGGIVGTILVIVVILALLGRI